MENITKVVPERLVGGELKRTQAIAMSTGTGMSHSLYCNSCDTRTSHPAGGAVDACCASGEAHGNGEGRARNRNGCAFSRARCPRLPASWRYHRPDCRGAM